MQWTWSGVAITLDMLGLALSFTGTVYTARAVIISKAQADEIIAAKWEKTVELRDELITQSRAAAWGLVMVSFGIALQAAGTWLQWWNS